MTHTPAITWYFDTISPFAWIALPAVEALAARQPVTLAPVVLGAVLAHWGSIGPAELPPKRLHTYRLSQFWRSAPACRCATRRATPSARWRSSGC